jgi:putative peptidoglycan lipid II flippase
VAAVLGPTFFGNLFQTANTFPNLVYELVLGSLLVSLLVPPLVTHLDQGDRRRTGRLADGMLGVTSLLLAASALLIVVAAPLVLRVLAMGLPTELRADQRQVGFLLLAVLLPQTVLYGVAGIGAAVQNAHGRFGLAAAAPVAENIGVIATFAVCGLRFGSGFELDEVGTDVVILLGFGTTAAVGLHAALQWWGARRAGHTLIPRAGWKNPDVRAVIRLAVPSLGTALMSGLRLLVLLLAAGTVKGGVVALQFAYNCYNLPAALVARPLSIASLPALSRYAASGESGRFRELYALTQRLAQFLLMPAGVVLLVLAEPISRTLTFGSMSSAEGERLLSFMLAGIAIGLLGEGMFLIALSASYARREARPPLEAITLRTLMTAVAAVIALGFRGPERLLVFGLGASAADLTSAWLLSRRVDATAARAHGSAFVRLLTPGIAAATTGLVALTVLGPAGTAPRLHQAAALVGLGALILGAYVGAAFHVGVNVSGDFRSFLRSRQEGPTSSGLPDGPLGVVPRSEVGR